ncbi:MAG: hypothetical protein CMB99_11665 [Flavobacteriaceae bacterium]|nr:hypothetical protein [Flavobacteriaceae bacterium]|tara:strand:- start:225070 stop:225960 length:891 start_codon:yes stop_codon:yes gene_type:complete
MSIVLSNTTIEVTIDLPQEGYSASRFDGSGKITSLKFKGLELLGTELENQNQEDDKTFGKGLYNEFGSMNPLGFREASIGEYCHKIGVGMVLKEDESYDFQKPYSIKPSEVEIQKSEDRITFTTIGELHKEYAYVLRKTLSLKEDGIQIDYRLENTGSKVIRTNEYNHNFIRFSEDLIGNDYSLTIPTELRLEELTELVNKEKAMAIKENEIQFAKSPTEAFFISTEFKDRFVDANWKLENKAINIGISETGDFKTKQFHLWGTPHVICPEIFIDIEINPNDSFSWSRRYQIYELE